MFSIMAAVYCLHRRNVRIPCLLATRRALFPAGSAAHGQDGTEYYFGVGEAF
jgi:hypothetical protein